MDIEAVLSSFESQLRSIGLTDTSGALLLQLNINGTNYIKSYGNLNNLYAPTARVIPNSPEYNFIEFMKHEIQLAVVSSSTRKLHTETADLIRNYNSSVELGDVNIDYLQGLELFMQRKGLAINTIARHMKVIKRYINVARKKDLITKYPFLNYKIRTEKTHREALTEKELLLLEQYRKGLQTPNEVLDAFLFSCYTGLRYSDICSFTKQQICISNRKRWIIMRMQKTNNEIRIPISSIFEGKALELSKAIPRPRGILFKLKNNQQTNRELKKIVKEVGIKKHLTFHLARHTCATLLLYRGVSITTVQKILGHQNVKTTQIYSAVTDMTIEREIKRSNRKKI